VVDIDIHEVVSALFEQRGQLDEEMACLTRLHPSPIARITDECAVQHHAIHARASASTRSGVSQVHDVDLRGRPAVDEAHRSSQPKVRVRGEQLYVRVPRVLGELDVGNRRESDSFRAGIDFGGCGVAFQQLRIDGCDAGDE
jgi:hypothetical protein